MSDSNNLKSVEKTLPSYCYYDRSFYNDELNNIWNKSWIYVCHSSNLNEKLTYKTFKIGLQNIIVLRDNNNQLKAYFNACRHRGSLLCESEKGKLSSNVIVCPYHQWSYKIDDGSLNKISSFTETEGFKKSNYSLFNIKVKVWRGCIFVNLQNNSKWDEKKLFQRPATNLVNFPIERMVCGHTWRKEIKCNWKIFWENFNECLHCPNIHPELTDLVPIFSRRIMNIKDHPDWEKNYDLNDPKFSGGLRNKAETWSNDGSAQGHFISGLSETDIQRGHTYASAWPSVFIGAYADHLRIVRILPKGSEKLELISEWLFQEETLKDKNYDIENVIQFALS